MTKLTSRLCCLLCVLSQNVNAEEALIAVATNFFNSAKQIESSFERSTQHQVTLVSGSTGKLYAQIRHGAPFDAFLAADQERPRLLEGSPFGVGNSRFTFAIGQLALASARPEHIKADAQESLRQRPNGPFAVANPALAPYGAASREALQSLQQWSALEGDIVLGESVGQTFAMVATGNVQFGIVALSQAMNPVHSNAVSYVRISTLLHESIRQDAVLLSHGKDNLAAREFLKFLRAEVTQALLLDSGYGVE
jgi:molybdate transport system substrate-binding protein